MIISAWCWNLDELPIDTRIAHLWKWTLGWACNLQQVQRTKTKWRCQLKGGILHLNERDYVFGTAHGDFQFWSSEGRLSSLNNKLHCLKRWIVCNAFGRARACDTSWPHHSVEGHVVQFRQILQPFEWEQKQKTETWLISSGPPGRKAFTTWTAMLNLMALSVRRH